MNVQMFPLPQRNRTPVFFPVVCNCSLFRNGIGQQGLFHVVGNCSLSRNGIGQQGFFLVVGNCSLSRNGNGQQGFFPVVATAHLPQWNRTAGIFSRRLQLSPLPQSTRRTMSLLTSRKTQIWNRRAGIFSRHHQLSPLPQLTLMYLGLCLCMRVHWTLYCHRPRNCTRHPLFEVNSASELTGPISTTKRIMVRIMMWIQTFQT